MKTPRKSPSVFALLFGIIALTAAATWLVPAGVHAKLSYDSVSAQFVVRDGDSERHLAATQTTLDELGLRAPLSSLLDGTITRPLPVPGSYRRIEPNPAGPLAIVTAPIAGMVDAAEVIFFVLVIGGFIAVFNRSGAFDAGLAVLAVRFRGREYWLIAIVTLLMALGGTTMGLAEETFAFYPLLAPVFLAAGYDRMVPLAVIYGGSQLGCLTSTVNPFSVIIASGAAGVDWTDDLAARALVWLLAIALLIAWTIRYTRLVRSNPQRSLAPNGAAPLPATAEIHAGPPPAINRRVQLLLVLFAATFAVMILGVSRLGWWFAEMTALFLGAAMVVGALQPAGGRIDTFINGARDLLGVGLIIGLARGITTILEGAAIDATIIDTATTLLAGTPSVVFLLCAMLFFFLLCLLVPSSSGVAVLTMPLFAPVALAIGVGGGALVSAFLYGHGLMNMISPSGLLLPSLAMVGVGYGAWLRFISPLLIGIAVLCAAMLVWV